MPCSLASIGVIGLDTSTSPLWIHHLLDAESGFFFAISLEPNEPTPHQWYSLLLAQVGRIDGALEQARRAHDLDPASPVIAANLANMYLMAGQDEEALRFNRLANDLGISKKNTGIEAMVAMRRGQWAEARRLIVLQDGLPEAIRPQAVRYVDAVADPKLVPQVVAEMRAVDPAVVPQFELIQPYMHLGQLDLVYGMLFKSLDEDPMAWAKHWSLEHAWGPEGRAFRTDPRYGELARRMGIADYWKQYGYPDGCRAGDDTPDRFSAQLGSLASKWVMLPTLVMLSAILPDHNILKINNPEISFV